jgi:hypothetical protein
MQRDGVDWAQCYREGMPTPVGGGSAFVVPFSAEQDLVVLMVPVDRAATGQARADLARSLTLLRHGQALWKTLKGVTG